MLLPHFWALALDVWDSRRARNVFPLFGGCGLLGGLAGGAFAAWSTPFLKQAGLMWTLAGLLVVAHALTLVVERHRARRPTPIGGGLDDLALGDHPAVHATSRCSPSRSRCR